LFSPRKHPQRSPEATPPVLSSAPAALTDFLSVLQIESHYLFSNRTLQIHLACQYTETTLGRVDRWC
jgi:hypothetical protein